MPPPFRMFPFAVISNVEKQKSKPKPETISMDNDGITGKIEVITNYDGDGNIKSYDFQWTGGDIIGIAYDLLHDHNPKLMRVKDLDVIIGPYRLRIFDHKESWRLAKRVS